MVPDQRRLAGLQQPLDLLLQTLVGFGHPLMLADVIEPGVEHDPTSTVPFKRSFQHNSLCGLRRLLALHFRGFEDQASCSRMLGGRATPAAWKTRPT